MLTAIIATELVPAGAQQLARQAASDEQFVALWLHGRPVDTRRAYVRDAARSTPRTAHS